MKPIIILIQNTWMTGTGINHGWGNGYVAIPKGHLYHGVNYNDIEDIDIHGGLTFSQTGLECKASGVEGFENVPDDYWVLGFDTAHYRDSLDSWPKLAVQMETEDLLRQLLEKADYSIIDRMKAVADKNGEDTEIEHNEADELLKEAALSTVLSAEDRKTIVELYESVGKWYA